MWKARPLKDGKFSKKSETNAAMSTAASSVVLYSTLIEYVQIMGKSSGEDRYTRQTLRSQRMKSQRRWVGRRRRRLRSKSRIPQSTL